MSTTDKGDNQPVNIPLFLKKLWKMVNDKDNQDIIGWNSTGDGFVIHDPMQFIMKLLPHYFKHNNLASFVRQLNFYDFHKIASTEKDEMQFAHHYFLKDLPETLVFITRKVPNLKPRFSKEVNEEDMKNILNGMKDIKSKHTLVDKELKLLKQENNTLWNEMNNLRVKYSKQTKIINKLIHFLISYIHQNQPSLLEIGYQPSQLKDVAQNLNYLQSGSSGALTYGADYLEDNIEEQLNTEEALNNILNIKTEDAEDDSMYSVQFPSSPNRVVEDVTVDEEPDSMPLEEVVHDQEDTDIPTQEQTAAPSLKSKKLVQIATGNTLEDVYQIKHPTSNAIYSIKYPKVEVLPEKRVAMPSQTEVAPKKLKIHEIINLPPLQHVKQLRRNSAGHESRSSLPKLNKMVLHRKQAGLLADLVSSSGIKQVLPTTPLYSEVENVATSTSSQKTTDCRSARTSQQKEKVSRVGALNADLPKGSKMLEHIKSQLQCGSNITPKQTLQQNEASKLGKQAPRQKLITASPQQFHTKPNIEQVPLVVLQSNLKGSQPVSTQGKTQSAVKQFKAMSQPYANQSGKKPFLEGEQNSIANTYAEPIASSSQQDKRQAAQVKTTQQRVVPAKKMTGKSLLNSKQVKGNIGKLKNLQTQNSQASELENAPDNGTAAVAGSSSTQATLNDLLLDADVFSDLPTRPPSQVGVSVTRNVCKSDSPDLRATTENRGSKQLILIG
ncbi:unnamed protein product [Callosobruchus maculatus]|uniref:HSF-type DNA-binding domain-containing protein n=1 Tax=Callosobruchus maculatus TaxID=64391 RepID=A0A653CF51_CALMS|nr:unnamed protein product [Callosobruchus maculatus]